MKLLYISILSFLIIALSTSALEVTNTGISGTSPLIYGDLLVFQVDDKLKYYDLSTKKTALIDSNVKNPSLFGFLAAFEDQKQVIHYYDTRTGEVKATDVKGKNPSIYGTNIAFSTPEAFYGLDFNNDADNDDSIIRYYNIMDGKVVNTKTVGQNPSISREIIAFETLEREHGFDLNDDNDLEDLVVRYYDMPEGQVINTHLIGSGPKIYKDRFIMFLNENDKISYYNINTGELASTEITANDPWIFDTIIAYSINDLIGTYYIPTKTRAQTELSGTSPSVFENKIVFATKEKLIGDLNGDGDTDDIILRYAKAGDEDGDGVIDFADNCFNKVNPSQIDEDGDGLGDDCDDFIGKKTGSAEEVVEGLEEVREEKVEERKELPPAPVSFTVSKKKSRKGTLIFSILAIIAVAVVIAFYLPIWINRRRKSFGF